MNVQDYTIEQLTNGLTEYRNRLRGASYGDKRRKQVKQDILFNKAMATLFETELAKRAA